MSKKTWRLFIMRDGTSTQRVIKVNRLKIAFFLTLTIAVLVAGSYSVSRLITHHLTSQVLAEAEEQNRDLRLKLESIDQRVGQIKNVLQEIYVNDDQLRLMADLPQIDDDTRQVGIGGSVTPEFDLNDEDDTVRKLIFDLDKIEREIKLQQSSFTEIKDKFIKNADLVAHTPSLRPVEGGFISSRFGWRKDPFTGKRAHHNGLDLCVERGTPVFATANGKVVFAKQSPGFGRLIIVDHGYGFRTAFGHLDKILVNKGQTIERDQKIGEVGNSGRSTGPHLHYEVQVDRKAVDPYDYLFDNFAVRSND